MKISHQKAALCCFALTCCYAACPCFAFQNGGLILGVSFPVDSKGCKTYSVKPVCTEHLVETADSLKRDEFCLDTLHLKGTQKCKSKLAYIGS